MRALIDASGHEVAIARDGVEGIEIAAVMQPTVALIDIGLPGLDGYEVASRIRSSPFGHRVTLVALSGYTQDKRRAADAGFDHYLTKPLDPLQLMRLLDAPPRAGQRLVSTWADFAPISG
jgi:CheY-like chemotaxis protein